jgi:filamentous hemagglutinin family protein
MNKRVFGHLLGAGLFILAPGLASANPTGGQVAAGSASINSVPGTVTINQQSNIAIINWKTFSIASGELTKFIQPSSSSAALNRVTGGQMSVINGTLLANGQVYLVNGNGVIVGPGGVVSAGAFTASTRDISDSNFLSGNLNFTGNSSAGVQNQGTINALGGNVYLIGKTVDNQGTINAPSGTAALIAGDNILLAQQNADGSTVTVSPGAQATGATGKTAVSNSGTINAMSAELKAANGNLYALAINNSGVIRATTVKHQGGHIYLTANSGSIVNSGALNVSATAAKSKGGSVVVKSVTGSTTNTGTILAKGGQAGAGGKVELSGLTVVDTGLVDTTTPGGTTGTLLIDPVTYTVAATGGDETGADVASQLSSSNVVISATNLVTISDGISWSNSNSLTLSSGGAIVINSPISGSSGTLIIAATGQATTGANGTIAVGSFTLQSGQWVQNGSLPSFTVGNDFEISGGSFLRATGGNGSGANPYVITDVYGLQGIASLTMSNSYALGGDIDASGTSTWNTSGVASGFVPIGEASAFTGAFDGRGFTINGLYINLPSTAAVGLFATIDSAVIANVGVTNANVTGEQYIGALVGHSTVDSLVDSSFSSGTVSGLSWAGGLVGFNDNTSLVNNSQSSATVTSSFVAGGLVGENYYGAVQFSSSSGSASGNSFAGGLVGGNFGTITNSYSTATVNSSGGYAGGLSATIESGSIADSYSTGVVTGATPGGLVGGLINGPATDSFWDEDTSGITATNGAGTPEPNSFFTNPANFPASWNFTTVWQAPTGEATFPTLANNPVATTPVIPPGNPGNSSTPDTTPPTILAALNAFDAYTANGVPDLVNLDFGMPDLGSGLVSVDNPDGDGGAINDGSDPDKKSSNIASGSSTSSAPTPSRVITADSGINSIFHGGVSPVQPPLEVLQKFEQILGNDSQDQLHQAVFGSH